MTEAHKCAQMRILFCSKAFPAARRYLEQRLKPSDYQLVVCPEDDISSALDGVNVVIPLMCRIESVLMDAGSFRLIQQWGSGLEGIDLQAARQRGIRVANVPAAGSNAATACARSSPWTAPQAAWSAFLRACTLVLCRQAHLRDAARITQTGS